MKVKLDPSVLEQVREQYSLTNDEQVAVRLGKTAHTVRRWRNGQAVPDAQSLVRLQYLTGRPYGTMLIIHEPAA